VAITWGRGGHALAPATQASAETLVPPQPAIVIQPTTATLGSDDKAALRALVRDQVNAALSARALAAAAPSASTRDVQSMIDALGPELRVHYDSGRQIVDEGISRKRWTEQDRASLRKDIRGLDSTIALSIVDPLILAVNRGEVRFDGEGPLF
jgi:hypothetical protein